MTKFKTTSFVLAATVVLTGGITRPVHADEGPAVSITSPNNGGARGTVYIPSYGGSVGIGGTAVNCGNSGWVAVQVVVNIYEADPNNILGYSGPSYSNGIASLVVQNPSQNWTMNINSPDYSAGYNYVIVAQLQAQTSSGGAWINVGQPAALSVTSQ